MSFKEDNLIQHKTFEFALSIIKFYTICKSQIGKQKRPGRNPPARSFF